MPTKEELERRLAPHGVKPDASEPEPPNEAAAPAESKKPPEPLVKTVGDVIRAAGGGDSRVVVEGLKMVGHLVEDDETITYTLYKPLRKPASGVDEHKGVKKLEFTKELGGYHKRRMATVNPFLGENAALLTWVEAFTGEPRSLVDRLHIIDADACIAIAHYIEGQAGNE
jgi:hypothetical protein